MRDIYEVLKAKTDYIDPSLRLREGCIHPYRNLVEKMLYCSGCGPDLGEGNTVIGKLGKDLSLEDGQKAAYNCMLNLLANLHEKQAI